MEELIVWSLIFIGGIVIFAWGKLKLWEWQARRPEFKDDDGEV